MSTLLGWGIIRVNNISLLFSLSLSQFLSFLTRQSDDSCWHSSPGFCQCWHWLWQALGGTSFPNIVNFFLCFNAVLAFPWCLCWWHELFWQGKLRWKGTGVLENQCSLVLEIREKSETREIRESRWIPAGGVIVPVSSCTPFRQTQWRRLGAPLEFSLIYVPFLAMSSAVSTPFWSLSSKWNTYLTNFLRHSGMGGLSTFKNSLKSTVRELSASNSLKILCKSRLLTSMPKTFMPSENSVRLSLLEWSLSILLKTVDRPMMLPPTLFFMHWSEKGKQKLVCFVSFFLKQTPILLLCWTVSCEVIAKLAVKTGFPWAWPEYDFQNLLNQIEFFNWRERPRRFI